MVFSIDADYFDWEPQDMRSGHSQNLLCRPCVVTPAAGRSNMQTVQMCEVVSTNEAFTTRAAALAILLLCITLLQLRRGGVIRK